MPLQLVHDAAAPSLDEFLATVEKRAYRSALLTTRLPADALDVVQDAMIQLVQYYRAKPAQEWPLLFQRILHNRLLDWHRQQKRQRKWFWQQDKRDGDDSEEQDVLAELIDERDINPASLLALGQDLERVLWALEQLPLRQRQAFLLRAWEGFDLEATATAMACSVGSVKTHYFRAMQQLRRCLE